MTLNPSACKNCDALLTGKFCQDCGQKADTHRITLPHLFHEFFHALTHADKGIVYLAKELLYQPGYVAKEYIEGKRKKYFNPLSFLVIVSAVFALVALNSGYFESINTGGGERSYGTMPARYARYMSESMEVFIHHGKMISIVVIVPLLTFLSWIFFRKRGYNFAENLVLQSLMIGQIHLLMVVAFIPAFLLFGNAKLNNNVFQVTFFIYMVVAYRQFFKNNLFLTIIKTLFIQLLFIVFFWVLVISYIFIKHLISG